MTLIARCALITLLALTAGQAVSGGLTHKGIMDEGKALCSGMDDGAFSIEDFAVANIDLNGDGIEDKIINEAGFLCSTAASLYCGTGGCNIHAIVGDVTTSWLAKGWQIVQSGPDMVLLMQLHGVECGGTNLRSCYVAETWDEDGFYSVRSDENENPTE